jgi:hypothetical protein
MLVFKFKGLSADPNEKAPAKGKVAICYYKNNLYILIISINFQI